LRREGTSSRKETSVSSRKEAVWLHEEEEKKILIIYRILNNKTLFGRKEGGEGGIILGGRVRYTRGRKRRKTLSAERG